MISLKLFFVFLQIIALLLQISTKDSRWMVAVLVLMVLALVTPI